MSAPKFVDALPLMARFALTHLEGQTAPETWAELVAEMDAIYDQGMAGDLAGCLERAGVLGERCGIPRAVLYAQLRQALSLTP